jgi:hypothetical protein
VIVGGPAPTISCSLPVTVKCAPASGAGATVSVNVADSAGSSLVIVWTVNGVAVQTNTVAGGSTNSVQVNLTAQFSVGTNQIAATVSNSGGCAATCSTTVTVMAVPNLYPIALHTNSLAHVAIGDVITNIYNGIQSGNFGWLTWAGSPSEPTLVTSLTPPGNSSTYINPNNPADHSISVGDWVQGKTGLSNSQQVRNTLDALEKIDIVVPVWDRATGNGNNSLYHVVAFARVRIISYYLPVQNRITARFLGFSECN